MWEFDYRLQSGEPRDGDYSWSVMLVDDEDEFVSEVDVATLQLAMDAARDTYGVEQREWHWAKRTNSIVDVHEQLAGSSLADLEIVEHFVSGGDGDSI